LDEEEDEEEDDEALDEVNGCGVCKKANKFNTMLLCDKCDRGFHSNCVGLKKVPEGDWFCSRCKSSGSQNNAKQRQSKSSGKSEGKGFFHKMRNGGKVMLTEESYRDAAITLKIKLIAADIDDDGDSDHDDRMQELLHDGDNDDADGDDADASGAGSAKGSAGKFARSSGSRSKSNVKCKVCKQEKEGNKITCTECDNIFHLSCLDPPLKKEPKDKNSWSCSMCKKGKENRRKSRSDDDDSGSNDDSDSSNDDDNSVSNASESDKSEDDDDDNNDEVEEESESSEDSSSSSSSSDDSSEEASDTDDDEEDEDEEDEDQDGDEVEDDDEDDNDGKKDAQEPVEGNEGDKCCVCYDSVSYQDNPIMYCEGKVGGKECNVIVHQQCYGVEKIPKGKWLCDSCKHPGKTVADKVCVLCGTQGGGLKRLQEDDAQTQATSKDNKDKDGKDKPRWCHISCAIWIPGMEFGDVDKREPIFGLSKVEKMRFKLNCGVCQKKNVGACIQCSDKKCKNCFHVACALNDSKYDLYFDLASVPAIRYSYCPDHARKVRK
jgi:hypothetical protein